MDDCSTDATMGEKGAYMSPKDSATQDVSYPSGAADDAILSAKSDRQSSEKITTPEPPRWRFINEAKKSLGYSSVHAGSYIKGKSSDDLGATYTVPDISLYQPKKEIIQPKKVTFHLHPNNKDWTKDDDVEVGKLDGTIPSQDTFSNEQNDVGKLQIKESSPQEGEHVSFGEFSGLPKSKDETKESLNSFKEWATTLQIGQKKERREHGWYDGHTHDSYKVPSHDAYNNTNGNVGRLKFHGGGSNDEAFVGEISKGSSEEQDENGPQYDSEDSSSYATPRAGVLFMNNDVNSVSVNGKDMDDATALTEPTIKRSKKRRRWLYLLVLLLLALAIVLGVLLRTKNDGEEEKSAASVGGVIPPPVVVSNETNATDCSVGSKLFSIEHSTLQDTPASDLTWRVRERCLGEIVAQCLPCSLASIFGLGEPTLKSIFETQQDQDDELFGDEPTRRYLKDDQILTTECLPNDKEYVLEIFPAEDSEPCCGFDPVTSIISYDNIDVNPLLLDVETSSSTQVSTSSSVFFGDSESSCTSESTSTLPSTTINKTLLPKNCSTEQDFNLCLAVDMSGSVCNDGDGSDCNECTSGPTLFGFTIPFFGTDCRDSFVSEDTCCSNFANVKGFSSTMVNLLDDIGGDFPAEKTFSVVQFATNAQLVSSLASADQTVQVIDQLDYTGGLTNHASAIQACQQTLPSNDNSRKNFIMLITDGVSSEPEFDPEGEALAAARVAKSDGTFIIPVFISPYNDMSALSFMSQLSSDGKVFDVTDFDSLSSLQDSLITQVSCS